MAGHQRQSVAEVSAWTYFCLAGIVADPAYVGPLSGIDIGMGGGLNDGSHVTSRVTGQAIHM